MEQKNVKNEGMSRLYKWLPIEEEVKPPVLYARNYSVVDQMQHV